MNSFLVI